MGVGSGIRRQSFYRKIMGSRKRAVEEEARRLLTGGRFAGFQKKYPHELSGGMQQRLAMAQSLIKKPDIAADEPLAHFDPGIRADMHELVLILWRETGTTVFMVTHDLRKVLSGNTTACLRQVASRPARTRSFWCRSITYDLPIGKTERHLYQAIRQDVVKHRTNCRSTICAGGKSMMSSWLSFS